MSVDEEAAAFVSRTLVMIKPLCLDQEQLDLIAYSLRYGYACGYRDADAMWTLQKLNLATRR